MGTLILIVITILLIGGITVGAMAIFGVAIQVLGRLIPIFLIGILASIILAGIGALLPPQTPQQLPLAVETTTPRQGPQTVRELTWTIGTPLEVDLQPGEILRVKEGQLIQGYWGPFDPSTGSYTNSQGEWVQGPRAVKGGYEAPCPDQPWIKFCPREGVLNVTPSEINYWGGGENLIIEVVKP